MGGGGEKKATHKIRGGSRVEVLYVVVVVVVVLIAKIKSVVTGQAYALAFKAYS